jgi:hypothetical protein
VTLLRHRLIGLDSILSSPRPAPRATAKGDQHLDGLEKLGPPAPSPCPSADGTAMLAKVGIEQPMAFALVVHLQPSGNAGRLCPSITPDSIPELEGAGL